MKALLIRLPFMVGFAWLATFLARRIIEFPSDASASHFVFGGALLVGLSAMLVIFDLYSKTADSSLSSLKLEEHMSDPEKVELTNRIIAARFRMNCTTAVSICLKAGSGLCGSLLLSKALEARHCRIAFDLGFAALGASLPLIVVAYISARDLHFFISAQVKIANEAKRRAADLKAISEGAPHDFESDKTLQEFGRIIRTRDC